MTREKRPLLSFIIPTYNCEDFLDETLGSVLSQLPGNCELIVTDDGSEDRTPALLAEYDGSAENIRIAYCEHGGASSARNAGLDMARGEWIAFMDCDDCLKEGFFHKSLPLLEMNADMYIFSFEKVDFFPANEPEGEMEELVTPLMVADNTYETVSDFADQYVRTRHLLVYSACNKFYRKELIDRNGIRFREGMSFGEDRLFNYDYLKHCGSVVTSSIRMFRYMQRNPESASKRSFPNYFQTIMELHSAKMECFLMLSEGTTGAEKRAFSGYDLSNEMGRMIDRFEDYPAEKEENLPKINELLFGEADYTDGCFDLIIVLGSRDCGYRAERALEAGEKSPDTIYLVTGGNPHADGVHTEAGFMAELLKSNGIAEDKILIEDEAENTFKNLELSAKIIDGLEEPPEGFRIGIVTAGFHIPRTRLMMEEIEWFEGRNVVMIPAYGRHTRPDNWYSDPQGRSIGLSEIAKCWCLGMSIR